jgi:hypothetical protein
MRSCFRKILSSFREASSNNLPLKSTQMPDTLASIHNREVAYE